MNLQQMLIEYLESKGWYFDWEYISEIWEEDEDEDEDLKPYASRQRILSKRANALRTLHAWTLPQWGEYWSSDHLPPVGPKPKERRYECLKDALWFQLLREEEPKVFERVFQKGE